MITDHSQRWTERRESYRRRGDLFDPSHHDVELITKAVAEAFVDTHHYSGSTSPTAHPFGLFDRGELVGVAVFGPPPSTNAHEFVFGSTLTQKQCVTLGRLVLVDSVGINGESWFGTRCCERLLARGVVAIESCADPKPRLGDDGQLIKPGHVGTIYQAMSMVYVGKTNPSSIPHLPDGTVLSNRTQGKLVRGERNAGRAIVQLVTWGATPPAPDEDLTAWLRFWRDRICTTRRHYGNHRYLKVLDKRHRRAVLGRHPSLPYPKIDTTGGQPCTR